MPKKMQVMGHKDNKVADKQTNKQGQMSFVASHYWVQTAKMKSTDYLEIDNAPCGKMWTF